MLLGNAFGDPDDVAILLFLQFQIGVEDPEVKLSKKGIHVQFHLRKSELSVRDSRRSHFVFEEFIFDGLVTRVRSSSLEQHFVLLEEEFCAREESPGVFTG